MSCLIFTGHGLLIQAADQGRRPGEEEEDRPTSRLEVSLGRAAPGALKGP
jgi:hypothetical protein